MSKFNGSDGTDQPPASDGGGEGGGGDADPRVPVQVATRTAGRLEEAEAELERLRTRIAELEAQLKEKDEAIDAIETRRRIDTAVSAAGAVDIEAAALLTAVAIEGVEDADIEGAVAELRSEKPFLFASSGGVRGAAAGSSMAPAAAREGVTHAAAEAAATGDRAALLRYLRMRRGV
jgi:hypothetical protein